LEESKKSTHLFRAVLAVMILLVVGAAATINRVRAQVKPSQATLLTFTNPEPLNAQFQYATVTGTTNTINATYVPLTTASGNLAYENLTIPFTASQDSEGRFHVTAGTVIAVPSPLPQTAGFVAGNYVGPGGGTAQLITLSGPGVNSDGSTEWSVALSPGATGCTWPQSATFYVGPLADNPLYARIKAAGITSTAYSYGVEGNQPCSTGNSGGSYWETGSLLGFVQTGNTLTVVSFSYASSDDSDNPEAPVTYTLISQ